jgi:hypothetical protein
MAWLIRAAAAAGAVFGTAVAFAARRGGVGGVPAAAGDAAGRGVAAGPLPCAVLGAVGLPDAGGAGVFAGLATVAAWVATVVAGAVVGAAGAPPRLHAARTSASSQQARVIGFGFTVSAPSTISCSC